MTNEIQNKSSKNTSNLFSLRLKELIQERNTSQKELGDAIGVTRQSISLYTAGQRSPDIEVFKSICEYFNVSADYMLGLSNVKSVDTDYKVINKMLPLDEKSIINLTLLREFDEVFINDTYFFLENDKTLHFKPSLILNSFISNSSFTSFLNDFLIFIGSRVLLVEYSKWAKEFTFDLVRNDNAITKSFLGGYTEGKLSDDILNIAVEHLYNIIDRELFDERYKNNDIDYLSYKFDKELKIVTDDVYMELSEKAKNTLWVSSDLDNLKAAFKEKLDNIAKTIREEQQKENV